METFKKGEKVWCWDYAEKQEREYCFFADGKHWTACGNPEIVATYLHIERIDPDAKLKKLSSQLISDRIGSIYLQNTTAVPIGFEALQRLLIDMAKESRDL